MLQYIVSGGHGADRDILCSQWRICHRYRYIDIDSGGKATIYSIVSGGNATDIDILIYCQWWTRCR
jgi:hypothetical protein